MMNGRMCRVLLTAGLFFALAAVPAHAIPDWSFDLLPGDGVVAGPAGSVVGWGYAISNPDPINWLMLSSLNAGVFEHGSPLVLFDFPIVAPSSTVSVSYDGISGLGLYELTWDFGAPLGFVNSGEFLVSADWYDGDPLDAIAPGAFLEAAPDRTALYSATVVGEGPVSVPEPSTWLLLLSGLGGLVLWRRSRGIGGAFRMTG